MKDSTTIIISIILLAVGLYLGWYIKPDYVSFEHQLNESSPLILDRDVALCKDSNWYFMVSNLSNINISDEDICDDDYYDRFLSFVRLSHLGDNLDRFFNAEEKIIETNSSIYSLLKQRTEKEGIIIKVTDIGRGKQIKWWE